MRVKDILQKLTGGSQRTATVKKNAIASIAIKGISIVVSLMLVPMTIGYVSKELYGVWLTLSSIIVWLHFFDVGFGLGLKNKLAEALALNDYEKGKYLVSTTYFMLICIFLPLCLVCELLVPYIDWCKLLNVSVEYQMDIVRTIHVLVAFICVQMIINVLSAVIAAHQKVALSSAFPVIGNLLSLIVVFIFIKLIQPSLLALTFAISAMPILVLIVASLILYAKVFKKVCPSVRYIDTKYIKELFNLGGKFFLIQIQVIVMFQATNILISNVSGPNEVTEYNIAYKYLSIAMMLFSIVLTPLWPAFTDAYTKKDFKWMNGVYKRMTNLYLLCTSILVLMVAASPFVYKIWIGKSVSVPFMMTLVVAIYLVIYNWEQLQVVMLNGIGAIRLQIYVVLLGLVAHIPLSFFFGRIIGAYGVLSSMVLINFVYSIFFTIQIRKIITKKAKGIWGQ